ncbi:MAG: hypothetical protein WA020_13395 [Candidatus Acidiferrales bacterium]
MNKLCRFGQFGQILATNIAEITAARVLSRVSESANAGRAFSPGSQLTASPDTNGYTLEIDRTLTQNLKLTLQYNGFFKFNGLTHNIDGMGRTPGDNNTLWLSMSMAF